MEKIETQVLPQNIEAEMSVLGGMIINSDSIMEVMEILSETDFFLQSHKSIFSSIGVLNGLGTKVDYITLINKMEELGVLQECGGSAYIAELSTYTPDLQNIKNYASIVRDKAILRNIIDNAHKITGKAMKHESFETLAPILVQLEGELARYSDRSRGRKIDAKEVADELWLEISDFEKKKKIVRSTGFQKLDDQVVGMITPHIWIIGGYTGTGKTFFTLNLMINLLRQGMKVVLFSTENNSTKNILRMLGCMTGFSEMKMYRGTFTEEEMEKLKEAKKELSTFNLKIYDTIFDTEGIWLKTKKHKSENQVDLVVIDYVQNVNQAKADGEIYRQMSHVSLELQRLSSQLNVAVIGVSQVSEAQVKDNNSATVSFKGAGEIKTIADVAVWLRRPIQKNRMDGIKVIEPNKIYAHLVKVRHGISGKVVAFDFFGEKSLSQGKYITEIKEGEQNDIR